MTEASMTAPQKCGPSVCEVCGAEFSCGAASVSGCWCASLDLGEAARAELRAKYERCLCRACLEEYAAREAEAGR